MSVANFHSARHGGPVFLGKTAATKPRFTIYEDELRPTLVAKGLLPPLPAMFGHGHDLPQGKWLMLGNGPALSGESVPPNWTGFIEAGGCGDCAMADPCHDEMEAADNSHRPIPPFSIHTCVSQYAELSGYDPVTAEGDVGLDMQAVIEHRQKVGIYDDNGVRYTIGKAISLREPGNIQSIWELTWLLENVDIGIVVTEAQEMQFNERAQPTWDWVAGSPEVGGHAVPVMGKIGCISWAEDVYYTPRFIEHQCEEAHGYIDNERYNKRTGETAEGFTNQDEERFLVLEAEAKLARVGLR